MNNSEMLLGSPQKMSQFHLRRIDPTLSNDASTTALDLYAEKLRQEFQNLADQMAIDSREGISTRYCVDFDVVQSAIKNDEYIYGKSFWSGAFIVLSGRNIKALPGMLYEATRFLRNRINSISKDNSNPFIQFFEQQFTLNTNKKSSNFPDAFYSNLSSFRNKKISSREYYILDVLRKSLSGDDEKLPEIDKSIFAICTAFLSKGSRADRWINNRADSINYSLVHKLNMNILNSKTRYLLVSNSDTIQSLDRAVMAQSGSMLAPALMAEGCVITPRAATMEYLLLKSVGGSKVNAERLAFLMADQLSDFRTKLRAPNRTPSQKEDNRESPAPLVNLFNLFDRLEFAYEKSDLSLLPDGVDLDYKSLGFDPKEFYDDLKELVHKSLLDTGFESSFTEGKINNSDISLSEYHDGPLSIFGKQFRLLDEFKKSVSIVLERRDYIFYSNCQLPHEHFISLVNRIKSSLINRASLGEFHLLDDRAIDIVTVGISDREVISYRDSSHSGYDLGDISRRCNAAASDLNFIRIDNGILTLSSEGGMIGISSRYKLLDEVADFVSSCAKDAYDVSKIKVAIQDYYSRSEFKFECL